MERIEVVTARTLESGGVTRGVRRQKAFDTGYVVFSKSTIEAGTVSGWHHHGARQLYGYLVSGRLKLEYGLTGEMVVDLHPGDFFHVPPGLIHRDLNPDESTAAVVVNILLGEGDQVINVASPAG